MTTGAKNTPGMQGSLTQGLLRGWRLPVTVGNACSSSEEVGSEGMRGGRVGGLFALYPQSFLPRHLLRAAG